LDKIRKNCQNKCYVELDQEAHLLAKESGRRKPTPTPTPTPTPAPLPSQVVPWGIKKTGADLSWGISTGNGIKIGVIDTGIYKTHPDLSANVKGGVTFVTGTQDYNDDNGHGSHVSGTTAALNNNIGVVGVAPNASLYGVKVLNSQGSGWCSDIIAGIDWSNAYRMNIITMSLGGCGIQSVHDAIIRADNSGIVLVAAAGNSGGSIGYPAAYPEVIAVTATDINNNIASFSSRGPEAELAAPGVGIYSTYKGGGYATLSGTSMATPHVTGVVAQMLATTIPAAYDLDFDGKWDPIEVRNKLHDSAIEDRKSTRLNSSHNSESRMPSSA
jgi:subtilisin family serine protease